MYNKRVSSSRSAEFKVDKFMTNRSHHKSQSRLQSTCFVVRSFSKNNHLFSSNKTYWKIILMHLFRKTELSCVSSSFGERCLFDCYKKTLKSRVENSTTKMAGRHKAVIMVTQHCTYYAINYSLNQVKYKFVF